jgi:hypothetical protein
MTASKWVEKKDAWIRGNTFVSSNENRLVFFIGRDVSVKKGGHHRVGFLENIDAIGSVMMTPLVVSVSGSDALFSQDGVPLSVMLDATLVVRDNEDSIRSVCLFPEEQEQLIRTEIVRQFQAACNCKDYLHLHSATGELSATLTAALSGSVVAKRSSFNVLEIAITKLVCKDRQLAEALERKARDLEGLEVARREAIANDELARKAIALEQLRETARAELESRRKEAERSQAEKDAELFGSPEGMLALRPELAMRKLEMEMKERTHKIEQEAKIEIEKARAEGKRSEQTTAVYETMLGIAFVQTAAESGLLKRLLTRNTHNTVQIEPSEKELPDKTTEGAGEESQPVSGSGEQRNTKPA